MEALPEFVTEEEDRPRMHAAVRTGWETVRFQLEEEEPPSDSALSTAALAP